jgi:hypothetical protein
MGPVIAVLFALLFAIAVELDGPFHASFSVSGTLLLVLPIFALVHVLLTFSRFCWVDRKRL